MTNPLLAEQGLPRFSEIQPEHIEPALDATLKRNREELEHILAQPETPDLINAINPLEEMHDRLHRTWSPVSHLQMVASTDAMRDAYNNCLPKLSRYATEMAQDERLYKLYKHIDENPDTTADKDVNSLVKHALRDFRLAGVDLPPEKKLEFQEVMEALSQVQAKFEQNLLDSMTAWVRHETDAELLSGIPDAVLTAARAGAEQDAQQPCAESQKTKTHVAYSSRRKSKALTKDAAFSTRNE